jgi:hypothetical protein
MAVYPFLSSGGRFAERELKRKRFSIILWAPAPGREPGMDRPQVRISEIIFGFTLAYPEFGPCKTAAEPFLQLVLGIMRISPRPVNNKLNFFPA